MDFKDLKEILKSRDDKNKAKILIRGLKADIKSVLKNLFGICYKNLDGTNILINKVNIEDSEIDLSYLETDKKFLKDYEKDLIELDSFDFIINCESVLNNKLDITEIANVNYLNERNKFNIIIFTDVEFVESKFFCDVKERFLSRVEIKESFSVINSNNYDLDLNEWKAVVKYISNNLLEGKENFIKSQVVDIDLKKELANNTILAYMDMIRDLNDDALDKEDILFLEDSMINELLNIYSRDDDKLREKIHGLISDTVDKLINKKILRIKESEKIEAKEKEILYNNKYNEEVFIEASFTVYDGDDDEIIYEKNIDEKGKVDFEIDAKVEQIINKKIEEKLDSLFDELKYDIIKEIKSEFKK